MKYKILTVGLLFGALSFAQNKEVKRITSSSIYTIKKEVKTTSNENSVKTKVKSDAELIASYKNQIDALNKKEAFLKADEYENQIAIENGWYDKANKTRAELKARIEELKK